MIGSFVGSRLLVGICRHLNLSCCKIRTVVVMEQSMKFGSICSIRSPKTFFKHNYCTSVDSKKSGHMMPKNVFSQVNGIATTVAEDFRNDKRETGWSANQNGTGRSADQSETGQSADQSENQQSADTTEQSSTEILWNLSDSDKLRLKAIQSIYSVMFEMGKKVPLDVTDEMWLELLSQKTKTGRNKKMYFFYKRERAKRNDAKILREKVEKRKIIRENSPDLKRLYQETMIRRIDNEAMARHYKGRMAQAMQFGLPLIVDLGYGDFMRDKESSNTAEQLKNFYTTNRVSRDPFNLIFCNIREGQRELSRMLQYWNSTKEDFMATITEKSYLDLYTRDDLVYLTPYSNNSVTEFNPNKVYIVGGYVDTFQSNRMSLAKAKRDRIEHAKLPLDNYLKRSGNQLFTIDQMIKVLLEIKEHGDWPTAFKKSFPSRKVEYYY